MFSKEISNSDEFLDMPLGAQAMYFHLGMNADDEGFVQPKSIIRMIGGKEDELKILIAKRFVLMFDTGVLVITHWKENNYLQNDRIKETRYKKEKALLTLDENRFYQLDNKSIQNVYIPYTQNRVEENRIEENNIITPVKKETGAYELFIESFNKITNRRFTIRDKKARTQFKIRLKEGWKIEEIETAIRNCMNDTFHKENNYKYLTPEFITRSDKLEKYAALSTTANNTGFRSAEEMRKALNN